jgi:hypothetical protein
VGGKVKVPGVGELNVTVSGTYASARGTSYSIIKTVTWPTSQMEKGYVYKIVVVVEKIADVGTEVTSNFNGPQVNVSVRNYEVKPTKFTGESNFMVLRRKCK